MNFKKGKKRKRNDPIRLYEFKYYCRIKPTVKFFFSYQIYFPLMAATNFARKKQNKTKAGTILYREYSYSCLCEVSLPVLGNGFPAHFCADLWGCLGAPQSGQDPLGGPSLAQSRGGTGTSQTPPELAAPPCGRSWLAPRPAPSPCRPAVLPASAALQSPTPVLRPVSRHGCALAAPLPARPERPLRASRAALRPVSAGAAWGAGSRGCGVRGMGLWVW